MSELRLAANLIPGTTPIGEDGEPTGRGLGHLQIVYVNNAGQQLELEVQAPVPIPILGSWQFRPESGGQIQIHDGVDPNGSSNTPNYGDPEKYNSITLLVDQQADGAWSLLNDAHGAFRDASIDNPFEYDAFYNSNTYANTLLSIIGLDAADLLPSVTPPDVESFPGVTRNALNDSEYPDDAIDLVLTGGDFDDVINTGNGNDTLIGLEGNDRLEGGGGEDFVFGGEGDDYLIVSLEDVGDTAADIIAVGQGHDFIEGRGDVADRIVLPTALITPPSSALEEFDDNEVLVFAGDGVGGGTTAIPLLGGIGNIDEDGLGSWRLTQYLEGGSLDVGPATEVPFYSAYASTVMYPGEPYEPGESVEDDGIPATPALFSNGSTFSVNYYNFNYVEVHLPDLLEVYADLDYAALASSLFIEIRYATLDEFSWEPNYVLVENFSNGNFGIDLIQQELIEVNGQTKVAPPTEEQLAYFNNNGGYVTIPDISDYVDPASPPPSGPPPVFGDRFDNAIDGTAEEDNLRGRGGDDMLDGAEGDDRLFGGAGNDQIFGGEGNDKITGGDGADTIDGGVGTDTATYRGSGSGVTVSLETGIGTGGHAEGDALAGVERLVGSLLDDILTGDAFDNRLVGLDGEDVLAGGAGNDRLVGGLGADTLDGGEGIDWAIYSFDEADLFDLALDAGTEPEEIAELFHPEADNGVTIDLGLGTGEGLIAEGDTLANIENVRGSDLNDTLIGDDGRNRLAGGDGHDELSGGGGNDRLVGGEGDDQLTGGLGNDFFIFRGDFGRDTISDFGFGEGLGDRIDLRGAEIDDLELLFAEANESAAGTTLNVESSTANGEIFLPGVEIAQLHADDFLLHSPAV